MAAAGGTTAHRGWSSLVDLSSELLHLDRCGSEPRRSEIAAFTPRARQRGGFSVPILRVAGFSVPILRAFTVSCRAPARYGQGTVRERSFLSNLGLVGAIALLALVVNGVLNDRLPAAWIFAVAIFGTLVVAAAVTAATHRSERRR